MSAAEAFKMADIACSQATTPPRHSPHGKLAVTDAGRQTGIKLPETRLTTSPMCRREYVGYYCEFREGLAPANDRLEMVSHKRHFRRVDGEAVGPPQDQPAARSEHVMAGSQRGLL
jgi:hypothetical protein